MPTADPIRTIERKDLPGKMQLEAQTAAFIPPRYVNSLPVTYVVSVLSATSAELLTYPLDLTKTRLQVQGEKAVVDGVTTVSSCHTEKAAPKRGMLKTAIGIAVEEGPLRLWRGMLPAIYRHSIYSGLRIVVYETLRKRVLSSDANGHFPLWKSAVSGATAGAFGQFVASPADLVKVQIQMEGKRALLGLPPRVRSPNQALAKIWREGGVRGLWKGAIPNMYRAALVNLGDLASYDYVKRAILEQTNLGDGHLCHFFASCVAGFVASVVGTPADVIKTRVMNQPTDEKGRGLIYKNSLDCLQKTVKNEGVFALYKGFLPVWIRLGPWSLTFWMTFEQIKHLIGGKSF